MLDNQSSPPTITEPILLETLSNVVEPVLADVRDRLARGDSEGGVIHAHRYEAIQLLAALANTLLEWYSDCEGPFLEAEVLPGWRSEAKLLGGGEAAKVPSSTAGTFTSIAFSVTIAKVMVLYGLASYDAQETLAGYKAVEQACSVLERVHETGKGLTGKELAERCSLSRRQYVTAGAPTLIFADNKADSPSKVRSSLAGGTLLLDCYVYMCMAWGRWSDADNIALCLNAATQLATELRQSREEYSRRHKQTKIDHILSTNTHAAEVVEQKRLNLVDAQQRAIEDRIRAKKAKVAAAKAAAAGGDDVVPQAEGGVSHSAVPSVSSNDVSSPLASPSSSTTAASLQVGFCFASVARSGCCCKWLSWSWEALAVGHNEMLAGSCPAPAVRAEAQRAQEALNKGRPTPDSSAVHNLVLQSSELLSWLHAGCIETEEGIRSCEARLLTASAHANKAANSLAATMYCHRSLAHQISGNLLKSPQDVEDWVYAALNLAEFYLTKEDLSHLEHCLLAVDSLLRRAKLIVPEERDGCGGEMVSTAHSSPPPTEGERSVVEVWPSFNVLQYRYLWASLHHHLLLLTQTALSFHSGGPNDHVSNHRESGQFPTSDAVISILSRSVYWVKCRLYQNPLMLPEGIRNLPSDEREAFIVSNVREITEIAPTVTSLATSSTSAVAAAGAWGLNERIAFAVPGVPPPRTHILVALPRTTPSSTTTRTTSSAPKVEDPVTVLSRHLNPALSLEPSLEVTYFDGCLWPTHSTTQVSRFASPRPEVADQVVAKALVGSLRWAVRMQGQLLHHSASCGILASVEEDFEKFLLFRRMEADGWLSRYLLSALPQVAVEGGGGLSSSPEALRKLNQPFDDSDCFPSHYLLGSDPLLPANFSLKSLRIENVPTQRDTIFLEHRIAVIRRIYDTELNPKAYRNVVRQADYDSGWSCLEIAIVANDAMKMHAALVSGEAPTEASTARAAHLKDRKARFLDLALRHFKNFVTGFYNEIGAATKAGKQVSDALEGSDFPTLFVGEMRIVEVLLKQGNVPDAIGRLSNHALHFLRQNPCVLRDYPELNANKKQCEELLALLQIEASKGGDVAAAANAVVARSGGEVRLPTRPYVPAASQIISSGNSAPLPVQRVRAPQTQRQ